MIGEERRQKYQALALSLALHGVFFLIAAFLGLFSLNIYQKAENPVAAVTVYDADALKKSMPAPARGAGKDSSKSALCLGEKGGASEEKTAEIKTASTALGAKAATKPDDRAKKAENSDMGESSQMTKKQENFPSGAFGEGKGDGKGKGQEAGPAKEGGASGQGNAQGAFSAAAAVPATPPRLLKAVRPIYPPALREAGIEGTVYLKIFVTEAGRVSDVEVIRSSGHAPFDWAASRAARRYRFSPALNGKGEPVSCIVRRKIAFRLD